MDFDRALRAASAISGALRAEFPLHAFSGALAQCRWGGASEVDELEVMLPCPFGEEAEVARRIDAGAEADATRYRQFLLQGVDGMRTRYILCGLPFEETMLERAFVWEGVRILSAEDWLLLSLFRYRPDVEVKVRALLAAQRGFLQWPYIDHWLPQLADFKEDRRPLLLMQTLRGATGIMRADEFSH